MIELVVTAADTHTLLNALAMSGISIYRVKVLDELSVCLSIKERELSKARDICEKNGAKLDVLSCLGISFLLAQLSHRPLLLVGVFAWLFLILYLPGRILFVDVQGNQEIPSQRIIEKAEKCGIVFGQKRRVVRSEKIKNALLSEMPELKWVGVNTIGCLAVISVSERSVAEVDDDKHYVSHVVATQDGVVSQLTVTKGTSYCAEGQAVMKGQVLVSGYTDCGLFLRAEEASAEVMAITERRLTAKLPRKFLVRNEIIDEDIDYSIQIGKNIVKLSNKAGIHNSNCAKIYRRHYLTLPGGFQLPLALIYEKTTRYENTLTTKENVGTVNLANQYLMDQMLMGKILTSSCHQALADDFCAFNAVYICEEMIGKQHKEEIEIENG